MIEASHLRLHLARAWDILPELTNNVFFGPIAFRHGYIPGIVIETVLAELARSLAWPHTMFISSAWVCKPARKVISWHDGASFSQVMGFLLTVENCVVYGLI